MKAEVVLLGCLLLGSNPVAAAVSDYARQWPVSARAEGAYALRLNESVYRQTVTPDISDLAAFNAAGEALPFGPMPARLGPPASSWRETAWFVLPNGASVVPDDLHLHIARSSDGELNFNASLSRGAQDPIQNLLIDVRAKDQAIEAIAFELALNAVDFSANVAIEASDDLQHWRTVVPSAAVAQLRQGGQTLLRRHIEFAPLTAAYLRVHTLNAGQSIPVNAIRLRLRPSTGVAQEAPVRSWIGAEYLRREGRAYIYRLPARVPAEQLNIELADDNTVAEFSVSARDPRERGWPYVGQLTAFRLRGAGLALDNEAMDIPSARRSEWRVEPSVSLNKPPILKFAYRPETWLLLTHGQPDFVIAAGSQRARRSDFPLAMLVAQARAQYGDAWQPMPVELGPMREAGGDAALRAYDPKRKRILVLWAVLLAAAGAVAFMVLKLLKQPAGDA